MPRRRRESDERSSQGELLSALIPTSPWKGGVLEQKGEGQATEVSCSYSRSADNGREP